MLSVKDSRAYLSSEVRRFSLAVTNSSAFLLSNWPMLPTISCLDPLYIYYKLSIEIMDRMPKLSLHFHKTFILLYLLWNVKSL